MSGQFFFSLLNPVVTAMLATTFLLLWRKRPDQTYLAVLSLSFFACGLAFVANDFMQPFDSPLSRIVANVFFLAATVGACIGALLRARVAVPFRFFAVVCALCAVGFCWFLFVSPSTEARIYVVNTAYVVIASAATLALIRARPSSGLDWTFVALMVCLIGLGIIRPFAALMDNLDTYGGGTLRYSAYWATVQAATPALAIAVGIAFLVALAERMNDELRLEADRDFLTGLLNRRGFHKGVQLALAGNRFRTIRPAVIMVDIDNFKRINDEFGHAVGDDVIAAIALVLMKHGEAELTARTGGEEFTLFYRTGTNEDLLERAEDIRLAVSQTRFSGIPDECPVTVSLGLYSGARHDTISEMMAAADQALYEAKRSGKDRAVMGTDAPFPGDAGLDRRQFRQSSTG